MRPQSARRVAIAAATVVVLTVATVVGVLVLRNPAALAARCRATAGPRTSTIDLEQAANATTIAAVGKRVGLPDHAVTVALAAALQESRLRNLPYGDRDSVGVFQQRPSQGWGARSDLLVPRYAAAAFFRRLAAVPGWEALPVAAAAQQVQRSAAPSAYARWEPEARLVARALTGEVPAGLGCRFPDRAGAGDRAAIGSTIASELGVTSLAPALDPPHGWVVACWLVGHAAELGISSVTYFGRTWRAGDLTWRATGPVARRVQFRAPSS